MRKLLISLLLVIISFNLSGQVMFPGVVASSKYIETSTLMNGLIGWWKLDESTGSIANEEINDHDATLYGSVGHSTDAVTGYALDFSGATGQYGSVANSNDFDVTTAISVSFYIKFDVAPSGVYQYYVSYTHSTSPYQAMHLYIDGDNALFFAVYNTSGTKYYARTDYGYTFSTGTWYHIVGICPGTASPMGIYVNNVDVSVTVKTLIGTILDYSGSVNIGSSENTLNGRMDDVRIYNRPLTTSEIQELYDKIP